VQLAGGMQADFRDQARKVHETADGFIRAKETRNEGHGWKDRRWMMKDKGWKMKT
jgi:hypothetical protein